MAKVTPGLGPPWRPSAGRGGARKNGAAPATDALARPSDSRDQIVTALSTGMRNSRVAGSVSQDLPATEVVSQEEMEVLCGHYHKKRRVLTVREFFLLLARSCRSRYVFRPATCARTSRRTCPSVA